MFRTAILLVMLALPASARADTVLLYDLTFSTPPHTVGLPPVLGAGPTPRETVSSSAGWGPILSPRPTSATSCA